MSALTQAFRSPGTEIVFESFVQNLVGRVVVLVWQLSWGQFGAYVRFCHNIQCSEWCVVTVMLVWVMPIDTDYIFMYLSMTRVIFPQVVSNCFYVVCCFYWKGWASCNLHSRWFTCKKRPCEDWQERRAQLLGSAERKWGVCQVAFEVSRLRNTLCNDDSHRHGFHVLFQKTLSNSALLLAVRRTAVGMRRSCAQAGRGRSLLRGGPRLRGELWLLRLRIKRRKPGISDP